METITVPLPFSADSIRLYLYPLLFLIAFIPFAILYFLKHKEKHPFYTFSAADYALSFTQDRLFEVEDKCSFFRLLTLTTLALSLPNPTLLTPADHPSLPTHELPPKRGSALFILLDQSASMLKRMDYVKQFTSQFIHALDETQNPQTKDLIGLAGFARYPYVIVPPTFEHDLLLNALDHFGVITSKEGEGTSISYSIYKTAHLLHFLEEKAKKSDFHLENSAILLVTDGVEVISPEDVDKPYLSISMEEASSYAAKYHIPLYLAVIFPELQEEKYAPQKWSLERAAKKTDGELFILNQTSDLKGVLDKIASMQRGVIGAKVTHIQEIPLWPTILFIGFVFLLLFIFAKYLFYRMAP